MMNFLLILLVPLTLLNFYLIVISNAKRKASKRNYNAIITELTEKAFEDLHLSRKETLELYPYFSDSNDSYLLVVHQKKRIMALVTEDDTYRMDLDSRKSCEIIKEPGTKPGTVASVKCLVDAPEFPDRKIVWFSRKEHKEKQYVFKFILENAEELKDRIEGRLQ